MICVDDSTGSDWAAGSANCSDPTNTATCRRTLPCSSSTYERTCGCTSKYEVKHSATVVPFTVAAGQSTCLRKLAVNETVGISPSLISRVFVTRPSAGNVSWGMAALKDSTRVWLGCVLERMRVLIVAGITTGALVAGLVSRVAMGLLRVTSPDRVNGLQSDDDFTIGKITFAGTYNLMVIGAVVGLIGFATYRVVRPWLIGPHWFRRLTLALGAGAVAGSMLVHSNGIDFTALKPKWLAIGLFIALPALFAVALAAMVDSVSRPDSWTARRPWRWLLPILILACFPVIIFVTAIALVPVGIWAMGREGDVEMEIRKVSWLPNVVRAGFLAIAVLGLVALIGDVTALI